GGGPQQRAAHGPGAAPAAESGPAGSQAAVLEPARLPHGPAQEADALPTTGAGSARLRLVGGPEAHPRATPAATVRTSLGRLRKSPKLRGHVDPSRSLGPVSLQKFVSHTGCLCSASFGVPTRFLASSLVCSPPTPLLRRPTLRFPLAAGLPRCERLF